MQMTFRIGGGKTTLAAHEHFAEKVDHALSKFANHLRHVALTVIDVNGPRGGKDKQCRCVLSLKQMQPIVIEELDYSVGAAIHHTLERAAYTISQRLARHGYERRSRGSR